MIYLAIIVPSLLFMYLLGWSAGASWTRYAREEDERAMKRLVREVNIILENKPENQ